MNCVMRVLIFILSAPVLFAQTVPQRGINALTDFSNLPVLRSGEIVKQVSSHDRTGGNYDFENEDPGVQSYLYKEDGLYVIFDEKRPGCLYRIWMTFWGLNPEGYGDIYFFVDGEASPRISMYEGDFFTGQNSPFLFPLTGFWDKSGGGYYSYMPIEFEKSLKIATSTIPHFYNYTYKIYQDKKNLTSFTMDANVDAAVQAFENTGEPLIEAASPEEINETFQLESNQSKVFEFSGPGQIVELTMDILDETYGDIYEFGQNLWIKINWDNAPNYQVETPIYLFFGAGIKDFACEALPVGSNPKTGEYYNYFPMPFQNHARIEFVNKGNTTLKNVALTIKADHVADATFMQNKGYFHATHSDVAPVPGRDYMLLQTKGTGHVVGVVLDTGISPRNNQMEGDERVYIDGSLSPQLYGTGTEDFFNGGWYFLKGGNFSRATHGYTFGDAEDATKFVCYRFFLADFITFNSGIKFGIEHGGANEIIVDYNTLTFWYGVDNITLVATDSLNIGNSLNESSHQFSATNAEATNKSAFYEGDNDDQSVSDTGYMTAGASEFTAQIRAENDGVRLRRRLDYSIANQNAKVYVNDQYVGDWYTPGYNTSKSWLDSDFLIPPTFTRGQSELNVRIEPIDSAQWTAYKYWIFCNTHIDMDNQPPSPPNNINISGAGE